eukprot:s3417_g5.t1
MPLLALTAAEEDAAREAADSDLRYLLTDVGVPEEVQLPLYHRGYTSLRLFSGMDETRTEVRAAVTAEIGLDHAAGNADRRSMALLLSAWETARTQQKANDESRAEARSTMVPRPVPTNEYAMLREALETQMDGRLKDYEVPSKSLVAAKMDDVELNLPRVEDLRDISSIEAGEADVLQGSLDASTGTFKMKPARATVQMPRNPEELRLRHRRLAIAWEMVKTKHRNRVWLQGGLLDIFRQLSDHILGRHVAGLTLPSGQSPQWDTVQGDAPTLEDGLTKAMKDAEVMNLHFIIPVTTSVAAGSASSSSRPAARPASPAAAKGGTKGKAKGGNRPTKKLHVKTPDGRPLCFKFNNNNGKCTAKNCNFAPVSPVSPAAAVSPKGSKELRVLYLFSGGPRKSDVRSYLEDLCFKNGVKLKMTEVDLLLSDDHDLSNDSKWNELLEKIKANEYDVILMSPPCSTWSRAVWANRLGPRPVRSREYPFGFPWLTGELREKAELGTLLVMRCIETLEVAPTTTVCVWEHPEDLGRARNGTPAGVWQLPELRKVARRRNMETIVFHQCMYGADYPKPTRLLGDAYGLLQLGFARWPVLNKDLYYMGPLPRHCGHDHPPLSGTSDNGGFKTQPTAAYPARALVKQRSQRNLVTGPSGVALTDLQQVEDRQPFMLAAIAEHLKVIDDPDAAAFSLQPGSFRTGVPIGVEGRRRRRRRRRRRSRKSMPYRP